jgi:NAD(P)-dependent dehydrogenase (short-subunit alcohol dehydrogenase family)
MTIALITGGSRGLGRSMAMHLADRGSDIIITYVSNADAARAVVEQIQQKGRRAAALRLDVAQAGTFAAFADALRDTLATWGVQRFDHLVNNAGVGLHASFADTT